MYIEIYSYLFETEIDLNCLSCMSRFMQHFLKSIATQNGFAQMRSAYHFNPGFRISFQKNKN